MSSPATSAKMDGGCLCGAVRFTALPEKHEFGACHCSMCRKWAAGPFFTVDCGNSVKIADASNLGTYKSSDWAERSFCKRCGSVLFYRLIEQNFYYVSAEAFDDRKGFAFTHQVFIDEKPHSYDFANKTSNMTGAELFAAFSAPPPESQGKD